MTIHQSKNVSLYEELLGSDDEDAPNIANLSTLAYIRPVNTRKGRVYAVCTEDGQELAAFPCFDSAYYTAKQFNLQPVQMH